MKPASADLPWWMRCRLWLGRRLYNESRAPSIVRLGFNQLIKLNRHPSEIDAMRYVNQHTTIPIPKLQQVYGQGDRRHFVMNIVRGQPLDFAWATLTLAQKDSIMKELVGYIDQLRSLKPPEGALIGSTSGGSGLDHRLGGKRFGPFQTVDDFHLFVRRDDLLDGWKPEPAVAQVHERPAPYAIKFTHADLSPQNVMVQNGKVAAIIDWEFAGWFPEYWEYTKVHYSHRPNRQEFYDKFDEFATKYPTELAAEQAIWNRYTTFHYDCPRDYSMVAEVKATSDSGAP